MTTSATNYSQTSEASTSTTDTNLTEIVEVDGDGNRVVKRAARPQGAPSSKGHETHTTNFGGKALDDVFGEDDSYWSDCSLYDTDSEISDDEKPEPVVRTDLDPCLFQIFIITPESYMAKCMTC